jgi:hypothetical protein
MIIVKNKITTLEESTSHSQVKLVSLKDNMLKECESQIKKYTSGLVTSDHLNEVITQIESCVLSSAEQKIDSRLDMMEKKFVEIAKLRENNVRIQINDIYNKINEITTGFNKMYEDLLLEIGNKASKNDLHTHILK